MRELAVLVGLVLVAGCGGAKSTSTSSTKTVPPAVAPASTTVATTRSQAPSGATTNAPPTNSTTTTTAATATTTRSSATTTAPTAGVNVRVPARFTIRPGGAVSPPTITIPPDLPVELVVASGDGHPHRAMLRGRALIVPARGQASAVIRGLRKGTYSLQVDGTTRARLVIGGAPGP